MQHPQLVECPGAPYIHQLRIPRCAAVMVRVGIGKDHRIELQSLGQVNRKHRQPSAVFGHAAVDQMNIFELAGKLCVQLSGVPQAAGQYGHRAVFPA
ncbi:hypothetical protein D3C75_1170220 [compost metagenome]